MPPKRTRKELLKDNEMLTGQVMMMRTQIDRFSKILNGAILAIQVLVDKGIITEQELIDAQNEQQHKMNRKPVDTVNPDIIKESDK